MSYTYYPNGAVQTVTDNLGNVTRYEYEAWKGGQVYFVSIFMLLVTNALADFVHLPTGYFMHTRTDMRIQGIIPVNITT